MGIGEDKLGTQSVAKNIRHLVNIHKGTVTSGISTLFPLSPKQIKDAIKLTYHTIAIQ